MTGEGEATSVFKRESQEERIERREVLVLQTWVLTGALFASLFPGGLVTLLLSPAVVFFLTLNFDQLALASPPANRAQREQDTEDAITLSLKERFRDGKTLIYSRLDGNRLEVPERSPLHVTLVLPSGKVFAISVKTLHTRDGRPIKVFVDKTTGKLRFRKGSGGKENFGVDPALDAKDRVRWLMANRKDAIDRIPIEILVFCDPITVYIHKDSQTKTFGENVYLKHEGVYVVEQKNLIRLIEDITEEKKSRSARFKGSGKGKPSGKPGGKPGSQPTNAPPGKPKFEGLPAQKPGEGRAHDKPDKPKPKEKPGEGRPHAAHDKPKPKEKPGEGRPHAAHDKPKPKENSGEGRPHTAHDKPKPRPSGEEARASVVPEKPKLEEPLQTPKKGVS